MKPESKEEAERELGFLNVILHHTLYHNKYHKDDKTK